MAGSTECKSLQPIPVLFYTRFIASLTLSIALRFVVATVIPPLLPTVFTVSVGISDDRLARQRIACTQSESILVAGKVRLFVKGDARRPFSATSLTRLLPWLF